MNKSIFVWILGSALGALPLVSNANLVSSYQFQGDLNSEIGGPALTAFDPLGQNNFTTTTLYGQSRQVYNMFGSQGAGNNAGLGMDVSSALVNQGTYSLEVLFSVVNPSGWRKIYDNSNRTQDQGLYVSPSSNIDYFPHNSGTTVVTPSTFYNVILTYNGVSNLTDIYVNGSLEVTETAVEPSIADVTKPLHFFMDDGATSYNEFTNSSVALLRVWNNELSASDVATIETNPFQPVPTPKGILVLGFGLSCLFFKRTKK